MFLSLTGNSVRAFDYQNNSNMKVSQNPEIVLGATVSLTGGTATEGKRVLNGYQLAISDINAAGGVDVGGTMYDLKLVHYDDQSDKTTASSKYDDLINTDEAKILLGPYGSSIVLSVAPVAESAGIPLIQAGGASDSIYAQGYQYVFGLYRVGSTYTQPFFSWLNDTDKAGEISSAAIFIENSAFPISVKNGTDRFLDAIGVTDVQVYQYASGDLDAVATSMSDLSSKGGADVIFAIGHYADGVKTVQEITTNLLEPKAVFGTVGIAEPAFVEEVGNVSNQVMGFAQWVTNIPEEKAPGITDFIADYKAAHDEEPAYHAAGGYAAVQVAKAALEEADSLDPDDIKDALKSLDVDTVWGNVKFSSTGVVEGPAYMVQIQDDQIETVYPLASKTADIIFPIEWGKVRGTAPGFEFAFLFLSVSAIFLIRKNQKKKN
jgi:branched-chain amino acid transport system substrate-binding protein